MAVNDLIRPLEHFGTIWSTQQRFTLVTLEPKLFCLHHRSSSRFIRQRPAWQANFRLNLINYFCFFSFLVAERPYGFILSGHVLSSFTFEVVVRPNDGGAALPAVTVPTTATSSHARNGPAYQRRRSPRRSSPYQRRPPVRRSPIRQQASRTRSHSPNRRSQPSPHRSSRSSSRWASPRRSPPRRVTPERPSRRSVFERLGRRPAEPSPPVAANQDGERKRYPSSTPHYKRRGPRRRKGHVENN